MFYVYYFFLWYGFHHGKMSFHLPIFYLLTSLTQKFSHNILSLCLSMKYALWFCFLISIAFISFTNCMFFVLVYSVLTNKIICLWEELNYLTITFCSPTLRVYVVNVFSLGSTTDSSMISMFLLWPTKRSPHLGILFVFVRMRSETNFCPSIRLDKTSSVNTCLLKYQNLYQVLNDTITHQVIYQLFNGRITYHVLSLWVLSWLNQQNRTITLALIGTQYIKKKE